VTAVSAAATELWQVEVDLLATLAGAEVPFPLSVPSAGRYDRERDALLAMAANALRLRGLADEDGPLGPAEQFTTALAHHTGAVHLVGAEGAVCALLSRGGRAVLCRQRGAEESVSVRSLPADRLADELMAALPALPARRMTSLSVPADVVHRASAAADDAEANALVHAACADRDQAVAVMTVLREVTGGGQVTASRGGDPAGAALSWVDTGAGRLRVSEDRGWLSLNPFGARELAAAVRELVALARR
jgi:hypothetical protein